MMDTRYHTSVCRFTKFKLPIVSAGLIWLTGTAHAQSPQLDARAVRHQRAVNTLRTAMQQTTKWKKVHAAEALLWNGYPQGVREVFEQELKTATPDYIHGVWRTLAQAENNNRAARSHYENLIYQRFRAASGKSLVGLLETLGKLGFFRNTDKIRWIALHGDGRGDNRSMAMARWVLANSGKARDEAALAALLKAPDSQVRGMTAYAFRFFPKVRPTTLQALGKAADVESASGSRRAYVLSSWYVHAPAKERAQAKQQLLTFARSGTDAEQYEVCMALALRGGETDMPLLERLLSDPEIDVRISAAHAIISIDRSRARGE